MEYCLAAGATQGNITYTQNVMGKFTYTNEQNMRSITLLVKEEKSLISYNFFRTIGSDDEGATYILVNNDEGGIQPLIEFEGTMQHNAQNLLRYFHSEKDLK